MMDWLKQQYNNLVFKLFPLMPSYIAKECYEEFDEKYKEFRIMNENKRFSIKEGSSIGLSSIYTDNGEVMTQLEVLDVLIKQHETIQTLTKENEELKQFKENVIKWVDSQMKFNVKKYIETEDYHFKSENIDLHNFKVFIGIDLDE